MSEQLEPMEQQPPRISQGGVKLLAEIYELLNDQELAFDVEKQARYSQLHDEAEKRKLL
jgi:hypothetical protein